MATLRFLVRLGDEAMNEPRWTLLAVAVLIILALAYTGVLGDWARELMGPAGIFGIAFGIMILGTRFS